MAEDFAGQQSIGKREAQEDAFAIIRQSEQDPASDVLMLLADGMGGHAAGEIASTTAIDAFGKHFIRAARSNRPPERLRESLDAANAAIRNAIAAGPELRGMGCTFIGALKMNDRLVWTSVGDSGLFLLRNGQLRRINADHSVGGELAELVAAGKLTRAEAAAHPRKNALRSAVTGAHLKLVDTNAIALEHGDIVLLATDGLDTLSESQITDILAARTARDPRQAASALLAAVEFKVQPHQDNTTVIVYRHRQGGLSGFSSDSKWAVLGRNRGLRPTVVAALFLLLSLLVAAGLMWALSGATDGERPIPPAAHVTEAPAPASQEIIDTSTPPAKTEGEGTADPNGASSTEPETGTSPDAVAPLQTVPPLGTTPPLPSRRPQPRPMLPDAKGNIWSDSAGNAADSRPEPSP